MKRLFLLLILVGILGISLTGVGFIGVVAKDNSEGELPPPEVEVVNPYFTIERIALDDGTILEKNIINGPPEPLSEFAEERAASIQPITTDSVIAEFPSFDWVFGCSAVSGAMIAAYYDRNGYPNMYTGPTNGGVMPLTDTSWPTWYSSVPDIYDPYPNNPLVASHNGVDGRSSRGSIDDYWVRYGSSANDPYIGNWPQHTWSDAIGDYMKTSQSAYGNTDGSTVFWSWSSSDPMTCEEMKTIGVANKDGTYGRKLFYEARGYSVSDCYNQKTDNRIAGGFSLADFRDEIDAGHPVLLNLFGHSIVGYGYSGSKIYIRDTWDSNPNNTYEMTWGGSYLDMVLQSVSVVRLNPVSVSPAAPTGVSASDGIFADKVQLSWTSSEGATHYKVYRNTSSTTAGSTELTGSPASSPYDDATALPGTTYYYWVQACNSAGCSELSNFDSGYAASTVTVPSPPTGVSASDGKYMEKVQISWSETEGAAHYEVYRTVTNLPPENDAIPMMDEILVKIYDDYTTEPNQPYYYWVKACNLEGCSEVSDSDIGWREVYYSYLPLIIK